MTGISNKSAGAKPGREPEIADRSSRGQRSPDAPATPTARFTKIARFQHGESAEGTVNTEAACLPDYRGSTQAPCSPCPPRFLRAKATSKNKRTGSELRHPRESGDLSHMGPRFRGDDVECCLNAK